MPEVIDCLRKDLSNFEGQITDLLGRKDALAKEIGDIDSEIQRIEPLKSYVTDLLGRASAAEQKPGKGKRNTAPLA